jgi:Fic family protein
LREEIEQKELLKLGKKTKLAQQFIRILYSNPITDSQEVAKRLLINASTAIRLLEDFVRLEILKEVTGYKRNRVFIFYKYMDLFS